MTLTRAGFSIEDDSDDQFGLFEPEEVFLSSELLISAKASGQQFGSVLVSCQLFIVCLLRARPCSVGELGAVFRNDAIQLARLPCPSIHNLDYILDKQDAVSSILSFCWRA